MTAILERIPYEEMQAEASQVPPLRLGRMLATLIVGVFFTVGWVAGASYRGVVFCAVAARYGYREGAHLQRVPAGPPAEADGR